MKNRIFKICGSGIAIAAICFVIIRVHNNFKYLSENLFNINLFCHLLVWAALYASFSFLLSLSWFVLIKSFDSKTSDFLKCHRIYSRSQLAKYVPGNVFHIGGRHAIGVMVGITNQALVFSAILEIICLIFSATIVTLIAFLWYPSDFQKYQVVNYLYFVFLTFLGGGSVILIFKPDKILKKINNSLFINWETLSKNISKVILYYILFFCLSGLIIIWVDNYLGGGVEGTNFGRLIVAYAVSWIIGFITPGASAGIGVREAILVAWLGGGGHEVHALSIALIFRLVTLLGDIQFYLSSFIRMPRLA